MSSAVISDNLVDSTTPPDLLADPTPIQRFFSGTNILVTGATGFLGKALLEKLLRACPSLNAVYILVRNKRGKNLESRLEEMFQDVVFDRLKAECPKFRHRIVGVSGDCSLPDLGLSSQDRQLLINEISVIFHVAATVRFDEKLKLAIAINVRGTQEMVKLSRQIKNLKSFVHVSTAYSHCPNSVVGEKFYNLPFDSRKLLSIADSMPDKLLDSITPMVLGKWPNTYAYTKAVAEDIIRQEGQGLPLGVYRPSIVVSSYREPVKGWINNLYGATGVVAGAGSGLIRVLHCDSDVNANIVPVDMVANSLIGAAWEVGIEYQKAIAEERPFEIPVYNFETSSDNPINWREYMAKTYKYGINMPSTKAIWYYSLSLQSTKVGYWLCMMLLHYLPALMVDISLLGIGKSPRLLKIYKKIHKYLGVIAYFATRNWKFESYRIKNLIEKMSDRDKELFFCDLRKLDWEEYFQNYVKGIRIYLMQDPIETLPEATVRWNRLYWLHQGVKLLTAFFLLKLAWWLLSMVYSSLLVF